MYPTRTTSTTGTFRVPPAAAVPPIAPLPPQAPVLRGTGELYAAPARVSTEPAPASPLPHAARTGPALPYAVQAGPESGPAPEPALAYAAQAGPAIEPEAAVTPPLYAVQAGPESGPAPEPALVYAVQAGPAIEPEAAAVPLAYVVQAGPESGPAPEPALPYAVQAGPESGPAPEPALPYAVQAGPESGPAPESVPAYAAQAGPAVEAAAADPAEPDRPAGRAWVTGIPARLLAVPREVALPHGRPAADTAWSEVRPARIRVEPEPVHTPAGAVERAESGGSPYGQEPDPLVCVPAPAVQGLDIPHPAHDEASHSGTATLRLRGFDGAGPGYAPPPPHGQVWPPAGPEADAGAGAGAGAGAVAGPVADGPAHRYGEGWPPAGPRTAPAPAAHGPAHPQGETGPAVLHFPQPHAGADADADADAGAEAVRADPPAGPAEPPPTGVPGPVADIVAQAVARGMARGADSGAEHEGEDAQDLPRLAPVRGAAVTEVPVRLPFLGEARAQTAARAGTLSEIPAGPRAGARAPDPADSHGPAAAPWARAPRPAPGRRVPRGDDRLREHRGPLLPGWVGVGVGGLALAGCLAVLWRAGAVPAVFVAAFGATPRAYQGLRATHWPPLAFLGIVALLALGGLGRVKAGHAWVLTLFGRYRGTVRRTGLTWVSPLLLRRRVDVRLRHWRSDPMPAVDSGGLALQVVVQVVWQVKDTARAILAVEDHTEYLAEQVESAMARVLSQLPADAFHEDAPTLRDAEAVGDALTRTLATETEAAGIEVYSAQPTRIEYAPEVAEAMRRRRVAAIDAKHRDTVLTSVVDAVDDTVHRLTSRGLVELDDYERKALVKDLTVAFYTGRPE
ncbi:SPFH domain-containing protein [Streptomyces sp. NPDC097981]|uniref:SPFH domain-containing protein n=1 Tax=Streptomyces sp. NPDC097981 TaxID=3155428 RepID=UPI00331EBC3B